MDITEGFDPDAAEVGSLVRIKLSTARMDAALV